MAEPLPQPLAGQIARLLDYLTVERGLSRNTLEAYRRDLQRYGRYLAERGVTDATTADEAAVAGFVAGVAGTEYAEGRRYRVASVARMLASVRSLHGFLLREGDTAANPAAGVQRPKIPRNLPRPLTVDEVASILAAPSEGDVTGIRDRAILEAMYGAGLRISELVGLDVDDVDMDEGSVKALGKRNKERIVPLGRWPAPIRDRPCS